MKLEINDKILIKNKIIKKKVVAYVINDRGQLLIIKHRDFSYEEVGIQVPAGTVKDGEGIESAAMRELVEETKIEANNYELISCIGQSKYDMSPYRHEIQDRYFYLFKIKINTPDRWYSEETHDGVGSPTRLECVWIPLERAHILQSGQSEYIWKVEEYLL